MRCLRRVSNTHRGLSLPTQGLLIQGLDTRGTSHLADLACTALHETFCPRWTSHNICEPAAQNCGEGNIFPGFGGWTCPSGSAVDPPPPSSAGPSERRVLRDHQAPLIREGRKERTAINTQRSAPTPNGVRLSTAPPPPPTRPQCEFSQMSLQWAEYVMRRYFA